MNTDCKYLDQIMFNDVSEKTTKTINKKVKQEVRPLSELVSSLKQK